VEGEEMNRGSLPREETYQEITKWNRTYGTATG
jgi:hypothetical protein